jgi:putative DNA primase/helicase
LRGTVASIRIVSLPGLPDKGDVSNWLDADSRRAEKLVDVCFEVPQWEPSKGTANDPGGSSSWKYHTGEEPTRPRWLIKNILPETGTALMAGQWGTFKTTIKLDTASWPISHLPTDIR